MALLRKLFEKRNCSVCGSDMGRHTGRRLKDGCLCSVCTAKLSPWYVPADTAEVSQLARQIQLREENRERARIFSITNVYGEGMRLFADMEHQWFTVTDSDNFAGDNPDIIDLSECEGVDISIREERNGLQESGTEYDFYVTLRLNHPYLNEISWKLNDESVIGKNSDSYRKYDALAEEIYHVMSRKYNIGTTGSFPAIIECPACGRKTAMTENGKCPHCGEPLKRQN